MVNNKIITYCNILLHNFTMSDNAHVASCPHIAQRIDMNPSINPNDFIHRNAPKYQMMTPKQDPTSSEDRHKETLTVKDMDGEQGAGWLIFVKKHRKFLLLQCMLIAMIVASFIFW